ncbi:MAG: dihydrodipicolinate synthase family protein [Spirochaetaceae bacterium]|nr:MAG: dihydrodipicolinate synthase family protein [Spirochaetaceae bacterium]
MVTPFTADGEIDYDALDALVDWYIGRRVAGLFAVCQSSEMFHLSLAERVSLAAACVRAAAGRVPVIASGHVSEALDDQIDEVKRIADTGVQAVVLISNRLAREYEDDEVFLRRLDRLVAALPDDLLLGFYECPFPYKRLISSRVMRYGVESGRFGFLKDTSCNLDDMREKIGIASGSNFKLFNANAATLLESLRCGAAGYSGVMANFHPDLYVDLVENHRSDPEHAARLQGFLGLASVIERQYYPVNAKYALSLEGLPMTTASRTRDPNGLTDAMKLEVQQMATVAGGYRAKPPA